ncbi:TRAP transporter substrate-binding protein [Paenibacillus soyae]|uniref:TRAP transporter substrate-binding protein n=1 Tax=Paenibacillus soyae TaxID=2969249 RepID=A0A9X2SC56_9BACL|nr:TRAP transporter substrate-binding protein [Paenibacillus soyae]MCR2807710.1 TRAP transporter substrate-binding protein [Paenibacillus soyae]
MRKIKGWKMIAVIASILLVSGCGAGGTSTGGNSQPDGSGNGASEGPSYTFRLAEAHPADYPTTKGDIRFAELVKERSGGRITIDVFPSAQLGEEKAAIEQVQLGAIEFTRVSTGPMAEFNKDFGVFSLPYIFDNDDHVWRFLLGETGMGLLDTLQSSGLQGLGWYSSGSRSFYSSKPLAGIEDLKGLKIRVQENKLNLAIMDALGASATPMPYGEVYSSLQTGVIDAAENNYPSYYSSKHYEVAPHLLLDSHQRVPEVLLVSKTVWEKLSKEDQEIIRQAALDSIEFQREEWAKYEKESEEAVRAAGVTITEVTDLQPWKDAVKPVIEEYRSEFSDILDAIEAAK